MKFEKLFTSISSASDSASSTSRYYPSSKKKNHKSIKIQNIVPSDVIVEQDSERDLIIRKQIKSLWRLPVGGREYNPSPNPVSIRRDQLNLLKESDYVVSEKSDGCRYMLTLIKDHDRSNLALMKDRACVKYIISVCAKPIFFEGTIFDGELVLETNKETGKQRLVYWIFDVISVGGVSIMDKGYMSRFQIVLALVRDAGGYVIKNSPSEEEEYCQDLAKVNIISALHNNLNLCFKAKPYFMLSKIENLWSLKAQLSHSSDGLIFMPIKDSVKTGTHKTMFKYKLNHTIDLQLNLNFCAETKTWKVGLFYGEERFLKTKVDLLPLVDATDGFDYESKIIYFTLADDTLEEMTKKMLEAEDHKFISIVECNIKLMGKTNLICVVKKLRADKTVPNNYRTIQQTILNMEESISFEELKNQIVKNN